MLKNKKKLKRIPKKNLTHHFYILLLSCCSFHLKFDPSGSNLFRIYREP